MNQRGAMIERILIYFDNLDRRVIYLFVALSLTIPITLGVTLQPAKMDSAKSSYDIIENLDPNSGKLVLISSDWGPGTQAENQPQTEIIIEHLMRRRIPFAIMSVYALATPFLESVPLAVVQRLEEEYPDQKWTYGIDWINLGFRAGGYIMIQGLAKSENIKDYLKADARGNPISELPIMRSVTSIKDIELLVETTGLVGVFNYWLQFFQIRDYIPTFIHGCTSITIPEAHIYLASGQIRGLHEGIAGAAWHEKLLSEQFPERVVGRALRNNTGIAFAQIVVIVLIFLGNISQLYLRLKGVKK